ncbi:hypothetical protein ACH5RR_029578 [Cinchona calisaya]|uniref:RNase H type-1 domain-containing protein n=1 Tax=Cinchona calisaya TaxID=153742 RepID=A0ABD2YS34_9GENT
MNTAQTGPTTRRQVDIWKNGGESFDVKIQVETKFCYKRRMTGIGVLVSSNEMGLIRGWSLAEIGKQNRALNDAEGLRLAVSKALQGGWKQVLFSSSNKEVIDKVNGRDTRCNAAAILAEDIINLATLLE